MSLDNPVRLGQLGSWISLNAFEPYHFDGKLKQRVRVSVKILMLFLKTITTSLFRRLKEMRCILLNRRLLLSFMHWRIFQ